MRLDITVANYIHGWQEEGGITCWEMVERLTNLGISPKKIPTAQVIREYACSVTRARRRAKRRNLNVTIPEVPQLGHATKQLSLFGD